MRVRSLVLMLTVAVVLGTAGWVKLRAKPRSAGPAGTSGQLVVTTTAKRQDLLITVSQTGVIAAKNATPVVPEIGGHVQWISNNGVVVKAGDVVLRLDPTQKQEALTDITVRYDEANRRQTEATTVGDARMKEMQLRLQRAEDDVTSFERQQGIALRQAADKIEFDKKELAEQRKDLERTTRLAKQGLVPGTDVERATASVKAAEFALAKEQSDYELKKSETEANAGDRRRNVNNTNRDMTRARSWTERDVRMSGNEIENLKLQLDRAKDDLAKTTITAPVGGLLVLNSHGDWEGDSRLPRSGDYMAQGRPVGEIVRLEQMQVKLELDQTQIAGVRMGQPAEVTIDALPGKVLTGKVTAIGQTARRPPVQGWMGLSSSATFPVTIDLPATGKVMIRPGMRASVTMISRRVDNAVVVPTSCIFKRDGQTVVFAEHNGRYVRVPVTIGEANAEYTAIERGLKVGDKVALNDLGATSLPKTPAPGASDQKLPPVKERPR
jgi:RND family efflux transporter MFP subunit